MSDVRAIIVSDLHLQKTPPVARSAEDDWFEAMARPLHELTSVQEELASNGFDIPILYAGDIFDRWNAGPEVINFAIKELPFGHAIPGQHDLKNHQYEARMEGAYGTLVLAGAIHDIPPGVPYAAPYGDWPEDLIVYAFPWGHDLHPIEDSKQTLNLALGHKYIWAKGAGYPGAPETALAGATQKMLAGFDAAAFGDNHKGFIKNTKKSTSILNCGGMMRRKTDERAYRPGFGLLLADGTFERYYFNTYEEKFIEETAAEQAIGRVLDMTVFVDGLAELDGGDALDFIGAMKQFMIENDIPPSVQHIINKASSHG